MTLDTLDTLTRASAEQKHAQLKGSLAQARSEFRARFKQDNELFRTLPRPASQSIVPLSPIAHAHATTAASAPLLGEDLVRTERLAQCCKRVRLWKRQTTNPLLPYKHQQLTRGHGSSTATPGIAGTTKGGPTSATDHRMHLTILMTMIVDMYEQKMTAEVGATTVLLPTSGGIHESFPEFVVKYLSARAPSRRVAVEQVHGLVSVLLQPSTHARVRTFASLCGLDESYNPPEKLRAFLHMLESVHRLKIASTAATTTTVPGVTAVKTDDATTLSDVVFYNIGVPLAVAHKVIAELFDEEYFWNFRFWHAHFHELQVPYAWPASAKIELEEKAVNLTTVSRSTTLNATKKVDGDAFLELLLDTWTQRAKTLCDMLEQATNEEEHKSVAALSHKQSVQDARGHIAPLSTAETQLFDELVDEFWHADVPWSEPQIQRRVRMVCERTRSIDEVASLYLKHVAELSDARKVWRWAQWPWDTEWEWGLLEIEQ